MTQEIVNSYFSDYYKGADEFDMEVLSYTKLVITDSSWITASINNLIFDLLTIWYIEAPVRYEKRIFSNYLAIELARILPAYYINQKLITKQLMDNVSDPSNIGQVLEIANSAESANNPVFDWDDNAISKQKQRSRDYYDSFNKILNSRLQSNLKYIIDEVSDLFVQVFSGPCLYRGWW